MSAVRRIVFRASTPDEHRDFATWPPALEWAQARFFRHGWVDGYYVKFEQVEVEGELPEDTEWLERELGQ